MRSTAEIQKAIDAVKANVEKWGAEQQLDAEKIGALDSIINEFAYSAETGDAVAAKTVDKAMSESAAAAARIKKREAVIAGAGKEIQKLETEHEDAHRAELRVEFQKLGKTAVDQAAWLSSNIMGFADAVREHAGMLRKMHEIAKEIGVNAAPLRLSHFWRFLQTELHQASPRDFSAPAGREDAKALYKNTRYDVFLESALDASTDEIKKVLKFNSNPTEVF